MHDLLHYHITVVPQSLIYLQQPLLSQPPRHTFHIWLPSRTSSRHTVASNAWVPYKDMKTTYDAILGRGLNNVYFNTTQISAYSCNTRAPYTIAPDPQHHVPAPPSRPTFATEIKCLPEYACKYSQFRDIFLPWPTISQRLLDHLLWQSRHLRVIKV